MKVSLEIYALHKNESANDGVKAAYGVIYIEMRRISHSLSRGSSRGLVVGHQVSTAINPSAPQSTLVPKKRTKARSKHRITDSSTMAATSEHLAKKVLRQQMKERIHILSSEDVQAQCSSPSVYSISPMLMQSSTACSRSALCNATVPRG